VAGEIELLKKEMITKLKALGIGGGLLFGAAVVLLFFIGVLLTAAILGLATTGLPAWLCALIVAFVLLVIAGILALVGYRKLKTGIPPIPSETISGLKKDLNVIKGVGKRPTAPASPIAKEEKR
jgi:protein-S-isoprenylcysteine O-methyltransferase Ste14